MAPPAWYNQITPYTYWQYGTWKAGSPEPLTGGLFLLILFLPFVSGTYWRWRHQQTDINTMKAEWRGWRGFGCRREEWQKKTHTSCEDVLLLFSPLCPEVNQPIVCGIHGALCNFNDPQRGHTSWFTSHQPTVFFFFYLSRLWSIRRVFEMSFNMILWDQISLIPHRDLSAPLYPTACVSSYADYVEKNTKKVEEK